MKFLKEYIKNPRSIGAIMPSSVFLAKKMINNINFNDKINIVELGPGTGVFTKEIIENLNSKSKLLLVESNELFAKKLATKYCDDDRVTVVHGSAENIDTYLSNNYLNSIDFIVSGLPFTSLPKNISEEILLKTGKCLKDKGFFITFQYSLLKKGLFEKYFNHISYEKVYANVPPAYVLTCSKK